jgi:hypothetical protein
MTKHHNMIETVISGTETQSPEQLFKKLSIFHQFFLPEKTFYILDKRGKVIHITAPYIDYKNLDFSTIIPADGDWQNWLLTPHQSLLSKKFVIVTRYPLNNGYILFVEVPLDIFLPIMTSFAQGQLDDGEILFVLTGDGRTVYHTDHTLIETRHNFGFEMVKTTGSDKNGLFKFTAQGSDFISTSEQFEELPGWSIHYAIPESVITRSIIDAIVVQIIYLSILFIFLLGALLISFKKYVSRPVSKIIKTISLSKPIKVPRCFEWVTVANA